MPSRLSVPILIGIALGLASAYLIYFLTKNNNEADNNITRYYRMKMSKNDVTALIEYNGLNIKDMEKNSGCRIYFIEDSRDEDNCICVICGSQREILVAKSLISEFFLRKSLIEVEQVYVPAIIVNKIISNSAEAINHLRRSTNAEIKISNKADGPDDSQRKITIKGTNEQRSVVKSLIEKIVSENAERLSLLPLPESSTPPIKETDTFPQ